MNAVDHSDHSICRILGFSDTFGHDAGNGVARFLGDLLRLSHSAGLPFEVVAPSREASTEGLLPVRAPSFVIPGYGKLHVAMPLRHHRKNIERHIKQKRPDCIHVSTPGPFGCFGLTLARRYRLPLVGIYHTDFPAYAHAIVSDQLAQLRNDPSRLLDAALPRILPRLAMLGRYLPLDDPEFTKDGLSVWEILCRNAAKLSGDGRIDRALADRAHNAVSGFLRKFYSSFDLLLARSDSHIATITDQLGISAEKIRCLRPGIDVERFHPRFADRDVWTQHGIPRDAFIVLCVGRISAEKNIEFIRRIWQQVLSNTERDVRLVLAGHGERATIEQMVSYDRVHYVDSLHGDALSRLYASADLLLFPSVTETLGQVGLEAGASGIPVMVADQGGPRMYVRHMETGLVLPTTSSAAWTDAILRLSGPDRERTRQMGSAARRHIENQYTLQHSIESYWDLHREAISLHQSRAACKVRTTLPSETLQQLGENRPRRGLMMISDFHAGKRYATPTQRRHKQSAIRSMLSMAVERDLDIVLGGDFGDHGAHPSRLEEDFAAFRSIRRELGVADELVLVRGNHDYGFTDERLCELIGGCRVESSLAYYHEPSRVTVCHGHIFGLARTVEIIRSANGVEDLLPRLREDLLDEELKPAVIAYDIANMIESGLASHGLRGLSTAWEGAFPIRAELAEHFMRFARTTEEADEATWKMIAGLLGTYDNLEVAALLGVACGGWASLFGHTHDPLAKRRRVRLTQGSRRVAQIVGNSGHINSKHPTCVVAEFPQVRVYRYGARTQRLRPSHRATLLASDINELSARLGSTVASPDHRAQSRDVKAVESRPFATVQAHDEHGGRAPRSM